MSADSSSFAPSAAAAFSRFAVVPVDIPRDMGTEMDALIDKGKEIQIEQIVA